MGVSFHKMMLEIRDFNFSEIKKLNSITVGLVNDPNKNDQSVFHQYLIFFDTAYGDHHL